MAMNVLSQSTPLQELLENASGGMKYELVVLLLMGIAYSLLFRSSGLAQALFAQKSQTNSNKNENPRCQEDPRIGGWVASFFAKLLNKSSVNKKAAAKPTPAQLQLVSNTLQLAAEQAAAKGENADKEVLDHFCEHFSGIDLSEDTSLEWFVVDAALRTRNTKVLAAVMGPHLEESSQHAVQLLKKLCAEKRLDDAVVIFKACPEKSACLYNALLDVCVNCKDVEAAERVMVEALECKMVDVITFNTIIKARLQVGSYARARSAVEAMQKLGFQPNAITFNEFLDAAVTLGNKKGVPGWWKIVEEMLACGLKPNHVTASILLKSVTAKAKPADVDWVMGLVAELKDEMDEVLLSSVVEACIRAGRADLLTMHLQRQQSANRIMVRGAHTYGSLIRGYGYIKEVKAIWSLWAEMRSRNIFPTSVTLGCMVEALTMNGDPEAGYSLIQEHAKDPTTKPLLNVVLFCSVLKGFSHLKNFTRVWEVYEEMKRYQYEFTIVTFNTLIDACARCNEMGRIPSILADMAKQGMPLNVITYGIILKGYCQDGHLDRAFEVVDSMRKRTNFELDEIMYNTLLDGCARQGLFQRGMDLLKEMKSGTVLPTNFTLAVLVKMASTEQQLDEVYKLCDQIAIENGFALNVHVFNNLMRACLMLKNIPRALSILVRMVGELTRPDVRTYTLLLRGCASAGELEHAAGLLRAAVGLPSVHPALAGAPHDLELQPLGGVPNGVVVDVLETLAGFNAVFARALAKEVSWARPGLRSTDSRLSLSEQ